MGFQVMDDEEELDFKMYIVRGEKNQPLIVLEFHNIETMERAEILAEEVYKTLTPEENKVIN